MPRWPNAKLCGARKTDGSGETCKHPAGWGTNHKGIGTCRKHGGLLPSHVKSAQMAKAKETVATLGLPINITPVQAIIEEVQRTAGHVAWLGQQVAQLNEGDVVRGVKRVQISPGGGEEGEGSTRVTTVEAAPNVWVKLYQDERKHLVNVCKAGIEIGLKEIEISIARRQGELLAQVIMQILNDLRLTQKQKELVPKVVPRHLQAVATIEKAEREGEKIG